MKRDKLVAISYCNMDTWHCFTFRFKNYLYGGQYEVPWDEGLYYLFTGHHYSTKGGRTWKTLLTGLRKTGEP